MPASPLALTSAALALLLILLALRPTREWLLTLVLYLVLGVYTHAIQWTQRPPPVTLAARQATGHLPLPTLDWRDPNASATVRAHLRSSVPLRITHAPPWVRAALLPLTQRTASSNANITIDTFYFPNLGRFGDWMRDEWATRALYAARFRGKYKAGFAHMDYFASFNVYYVYTGTKRVQLVPWYHSEARPLAHGFDSAHVEGSLEAAEWHKAYPSYYDFDVAPNDVLLFNSSACLHKFTNTTPYTDIASIHTLSQYAAPVVHQGERWNWATARYFAGIVMEGKTERNPYEV